MAINFLWAIIPATVKALSNFRRVNELYKHVQSQQKDLALYHLGHWVKLKVGGQPFFIRRRTLTWYEGSVFSSIAIYDKNTTQRLTDLFKKPFSLSPSGMTDKQDHPYDHPTEQSISSPSTDAECEPSDRKQVDSDTQVVIIQSPKNHHKNSIGDRSSPYFKFEKDTDGFYMIDRDANLFTIVLNYLRTGEIGQIPLTIDINTLILEAQFYHLIELEDLLKNMIINQKRKKEREFILLNNQFQENDNPPYFLIERVWVDEWRKFINSDDNLPPPPVNNHSLFQIDQHGGNLRHDLVYIRDYVCVSKDTWIFIEQQYPSSGPLLIRTTKSIYDKPVESPILVIM